VVLWRKHILHVESDLDTCGLIIALLSGYDVSTAHSLIDGLSLARSECYDLYLLGHRFPDGTGEGLCRSIRSFDRRTPIAFLAAAPDAPDHEHTLAAGAQALLINPGDLEQLEPTILCLLGARDADAGTCRARQAGPLPRRPRSSHK
jgi:DNA-binding response OmpR family regulator